MKGLLFLVSRSLIRHIAAAQHNEIPVLKCDRRPVGKEFGLRRIKQKAKSREQKENKKGRKRRGKGGPILSKYVQYRDEEKRTGQAQFIHQIWSIN